MINNLDERNILLTRFKKLDCETTTEIEREYMPHYGIYEKESKSKSKYYCTHCKKVIENDTLSRAYFPVLHHRTENLC